MKEIIREMGSVLVAYSGGVDSTLLMRVARDVLGEKAVGALASSETYPSVEILAAKRLAHEMKVRLISFHTDELADPAFEQNNPDRCYHCKKELFGKMQEIAAEEGLDWIAHGANVDDMGDYRPGAQAAEELGIRAPLQEAEFTKAEIRELSKELGLPTWDKPSFACLSSRFPYGTPITRDALVQIGEAEKLLHDLGFRQVRVRHHDTIARIEIEPEELPKILESGIRKRIGDELKKLGYLYVTIDIEGYRMGSMNAPLGR